MAGRIFPQRVVELTAALVGVPSHDTGAEAQQLAARLLEGAGFRCELQDIRSGHPNLTAVRGTGGPFLCSHVDTHPPHAHPSPYTCREEDGSLIGRGVLDAKGQIAALIAAAEAAPEAPATILITSDEETTGQGSELCTLPEDTPRTFGGVVLEPTGFEICVAQAGCIDLRIEASTPGAHAHSDDGPASALDIVLGACDALADASFLSTTHPLLPQPRRQLGTLTGGEHLWRRAAGAEATLALTLLPGVDPETARTEVEDTLGALTAAWGATRAELRFEILDVCEPIELLPGPPVIDRLARAADAPFTPAGMPSWTDAANLLRKHGFPCVVFGAGDLTSAHSDDERIAASDLVRLAEILSRFLED